MRSARAWGRRSGAEGVEVSSAVDTGDDGTFIIEFDVPDSGECDAFAQECPEGQKCAPYADDGGSTWNNTKYVDVAEDPAQVGEPCVAEEFGLGGIDDCDVGLFCWDVDEQNVPSGHTGARSATRCASPTGTRSCACWTRRARRGR